MALVWYHEAMELDEGQCSGSITSPTAKQRSLRPHQIVPRTPTCFACVVDQGLKVSFEAVPTLLRLSQFRYISARSQLVSSPKAAIISSPSTVGGSKVAMGKHRETVATPPQPSVDGAFLARRLIDAQVLLLGNPIDDQRPALSQCSASPVASEYGTIR